MKYLFLFVFFVFLSILATGCATMSESNQKKKVPLSEAQQLEIQMRQVKAISETALGVSQEAQKYAQYAYNTSNQANATADTAFENANNAIKAAQQATENAQKSAQEAMNYANQSSQKSIEAANNAIKISNKNSEKSIATANQIMAEMGKLKATVKTVQYEPILPGRPAVFSNSGTTAGVKYTIRPGDTLSGISLRFYGNANEWKRIYNANREVLKTPSDLIIGTEIIIPQQ